MFTGIVEELGVVTAVDARSESAALTIACQTVLGDVSHGASIAVNGVCLTVTSFARPGLDGGAETGTAGGPPGPPGTTDGPSAFTADVMRETLVRSSLGKLAVGDRVNLERPVRLADRLGGHLVQGHVDGVGTVLDRQPGEGWEFVRVALPEGLDRYLVAKGSVTVDGVSLTVVDISPAGGDSPATFTVSLIPTTLELTTLGRRAPGSLVNIEVDVLAKYVEKLHAGPIEPNGRHR
ncbi:riboflavin synthase subunit alpha [Frankia sp. CcI156]|uniref:riboflavin synthase n=1 Tax=Frankia TaxID=1854 RepID=UPI0003D05A9E|nr:MULTISPECIES: riboflavin synthase [Frankia]ETA01073.1 riboflavin synthase alpha chain [Frankia sp. CcI6]KDA42123.1 riboflavin synthase alpha chain [Frankia sp. BMG5.23]KEZ35498.1 riboflavin synthase alpha chain [Frankia sp. CeD]KFB03666.1 riboflavin synthase alpha chain [Frankia sp. Allo2]OAA22404.1 riboflavin synthase alpha chain [Frankia casuarinae]